MYGEYGIFELGNLSLLSGDTLPNARLAYRTYGNRRSARATVLLPTFYTGSHIRNEGFFGAGRAIDPARHYIISVNLFGNGFSSSPSNTSPPFDGPRFPPVSIYDNIAAQYRLVTEVLEVTGLDLVAGWSMAGCQAYHWAAQYPGMVRSILPFCASARTSPHNFVFLEGVKAALCADQSWRDGDYISPPIDGLKAFGRVYAGWAFSQTFYRDGLYRKLGFDTIEDLLANWERDHVENWDANNLLAKLETWQTADIAANPAYGGDFTRALGAISARAILMPCAQDLYFPPEDNAIEARHMPNAELRVHDSPFGHCAASPGVDEGFASALDDGIRELLGESSG